jgi:preprotein translocase subunit SecF
VASAGAVGEPVGNCTEPASDVAGPDLSDDDVLATELRRERAMAAAAGAPSRSGKSTRTGGAHAVRPRGKSGRPSGKRHR